LIGTAKAVPFFWDKRVEKVAEEAAERRSLIQTQKGSTTAFQ
jgi:hypothetical protein